MTDDQIKRQYDIGLISLDQATQDLLVNHPDWTDQQARDWLTTSPYDQRPQ